MGLSESGDALGPRIIVRTDYTCHFCLQWKGTANSTGERAGGYVWGFEGGKRTSSEIFIEWRRGRGNRFYHAGGEGLDFLKGKNGRVFFNYREKTEGV